LHFCVKLIYDFKHYVPDQQKFKHCKLVKLDIGNIRNLKKNKAHNSNTNEVGDLTQCTLSNAVKEGMSSVIYGRRCGTTSSRKPVKFCTGFCNYGRKPNLLELSIGNAKNSEKD